MKVFAIHEGLMGEGCTISGMYFDVTLAVSYAISKVDMLQKEMAYVVNHHAKEWVEKDIGVVKYWTDGINEIYIVEYNVK